MWTKKTLRVTPEFPPGNSTSATSTPGTTTLADIFCGPDAATAHKAIAMGVAKERLVFYDKLLGNNLMKTATQQAAYPREHGNMPRLTIAAPPCTIWAGFSHMNFEEVDLRTETCRGSILHRRPTGQTSTTTPHRRQLLHP